MHTNLFIPFAAVSAPDAAKHVQALRLPNLRQLLAILTKVNSDRGTAETFSPPHDRALARTQGLPVLDGGIPWAAQRAVTLGLPNAHTAPWCFVTLCHCAIGMNDIQLQNPDLLQVNDAESQTLLTDMQPFFAEDGLTLYSLVDLPNTWLMSGQPLRGLRTASLDRVIGKNINPWQATGTHSAKLHRLQNEMQMLLYTHKVNTARDRNKAANINSLWFHGSGEWAAHATQSETITLENSEVPRSLALPAFQEDWATWATVWEALDASVCADALKRLNAGEPITLTLCGERNALTYTYQPKNLAHQFSRRLLSHFGIKPSYLLTKVLLDM